MIRRYGKKSLVIYFKHVSGIFYTSIITLLFYNKSEKSIMLDTQIKIYLN